MCHDTIAEDWQTRPCHVIIFFMFLICGDLKLPAAIHIKMFRLRGKEGYSQATTVTVLCLAVGTRPDLGNC